MTEPSLARPMLVYDRIAANKRTTWFMLIGFVVILTALVGLIIVALGAPIGFIGFAGIALILYAVVSYWISTNAVLSISGAHEVTKEEEWEFVRRVENLAIGSGLPMPRTWVLEDSAPNAFATGRDPKHAHVVATRGLLDKLEPIELEGVLAHEMSHIGNYDIRVMTVATVLVGLIALVSDLFLRWSFLGTGGRRSNRDSKGGGGIAIVIIILAILAAVLAPLIAQAIKFAVSRQREYLADASGAMLSRHPEALARALEKIALDPEPLEAANKATAHMYIENPLKGHESFLNNLFSTHPPVQERIRLLRSM